MIWTGFPSTGLWAVGLLFGVSLFSTGLSLVGIALMGRRASVVGEPVTPESWITGRLTTNGSNWSRA